MSDSVHPFHDLTHEIRLNRSYYVKSEQMATWLSDNVGAGNAWGLTHQHVHPECVKWHMDRMLGYITIRFKDEADLIQFQLTWHV